MSQTVQETPHRLSPPRRRALFLRHLRDGGYVREAASLAGIPRWLLYRWREKDARFRARWDSCDVVLRHEAEDVLMRLMRDGERVTFTPFARDEPRFGVPFSGAVSDGKP